MVENSLRDIAKKVGIDKDTVGKIKKKTGKTGEELKKEAKKVVKTRKKADEKVKKSKSIEFDIKDENMISDISGSTLKEKLADAKRDYDFNNKTIKKLQTEILELQTLITDNSNGTISTIPQVKELREFIKLNISLRNQIDELEEKLGIITTDESDNDPFA